MAKKKKPKTSMKIDFENDVIDASGLNSTVNMEHFVDIVTKYYEKEDKQPPFYRKHTQDKQIVGLGKRRGPVILRETRTYLNKGASIVFKDITIPGPAFLFKIIPEKKESGPTAQIVEANREAIVKE